MWYNMPQKRGMFMEKFEIVTLLQKDFDFYCKNEEYYEKFANNDYSRAFHLVADKIKNDLKKYNLSWFLKYLQNSSQKDLLPRLSNMLNKLSNLQINFSFNYLKKALTEYPELDTLLEGLLISFDSITYTELYNLASDTPTFDFLCTYAKIKGILKDELEFAANGNLNDQFISANALELYTSDITDAQKLDNAKTNEYFKKLEEIKLALNNTSDAQKRRRLEKEYNNYRNIIIKSYLPFVMKFAKHYERNGVDLLDLIQEGNLGLIEAIDRYDYRNGGNFLAYVIFRVRSKINQAIANQGYNFKINTNVSDKIKKIGILERKCLAQLNRKPTSEELAEALYVDESTLNSLKTLAESPIPWETITDLESHSEEEIKGVRDLFTSYALEEKSLEDNFIWHGALLEELNKGIDTMLNFNEKIVIRMHYGIPDPNNYNPLFNEEHTLEEISKYLNLSSTRVWQISEKNSC